MKPTLYLETTVVSYLISRPSRDVLVLAHQEITRTWWHGSLPSFEVFISPAVLEEAGRGDPSQAAERLLRLGDFAVLAATEVVEELTRLYLEQFSLSASAVRDAAHLAFAVSYQVEYMVTWNCSHLANAQVRRRLQAMNNRRGLETPTICTPEELMEVHPR